jgi:hypothetical protein
LIEPSDTGAPVDTARTEAMRAIGVPLPGSDSGSRAAGEDALTPPGRDGAFGVNTCWRPSSPAHASSDTQQIGRRRLARTIRRTNG